MTSLQADLLVTLGGGLVPMIPRKCHVEIVWYGGEILRGSYAHPCRRRAKSNSSGLEAYGVLCDRVSSAHRQALMLEPTLKGSLACRGTMMLGVGDPLNSLHSSIYFHSDILACLSP